MKNSTSGVVFLIRKTSLGIEEIGRMGLKQFGELIEEVQFQEEVSQYQTAIYVGNIIATIANTVPRKSNRTYKAADFITMREPRRASAAGAPGSKEELEALAKRFQIKLPSREMRDI